MLKTTSTLTTLNLQNNLISDNGAQALSEALKINSSLTTLNLKSNLIGDSGAQTLAQALKSNSSPTTLDLRRNNGFGGTLALVLHFAQDTARLFPSVVVIPVISDNLIND